MPARLSVHFAQLPTRLLTLQDGGDYLVGREGGCELLLDDDRVSRRHARLRHQGNGWQLTDLGSKNGTTVDGVEAGDAALGECAWLSFGGLLARFETISERELRAAARREAERWQTSRVLAQRLDPAAGLDRVLAEAVRSVLEISGAERGFVVLTRPEGGIDVAHAVGMDGADGEPGFAGSTRAVRRTLETGAPVVLTDVRREALLAQRPSVIEEGIRALICLPLPGPERTIGALYADSRRPGRTFTELDVELLSGFASQAALAIAAARIHRELLRIREELPTRTGDAAVGAADPWDRALPPYRPDGEDLV